MAREISEQAVRRLERGRGAPRLVSYAGFVSRLIATVVDLLIIFTIWLIGGIGVRFFGQTSGISQLVNFLQGFFDWITPLQQFVVSTAFAVLMLLSLGFFYFTFLYSFGGASVGKYLMGLRVLRSDGRPISGLQAALRTLAYALSSLPLYLGFFNVLLDDRRRTFHDIVTRTVVVHSWHARPDENFLRQAIERVDRREQP